MKILGSGAFPFLLYPCLQQSSENMDVSYFIESWNGLGWKGPERSSGSNPPAISRDIFHQTRLLRAPSNLAVNPAREGAATASLGNLGQGFTTLMGKNFFLISHLNLPSAFVTVGFPSPSKAP